MEYLTTYPDGCDDPRFNSNLTNFEAYAYSWMYSTAEVRIFTIALPIALIVSTLGNGVFLFVVAKVQRLHTLTNFYLANLAFADVAFVVTSVGSYLYAFMDSPVRYDAPYNSPVGCALSFGVANVMYYTSLGLVCLVTLERYYGICYPLRHRVIASKNRTKKLIAITWLLGCLLSAIRTLKYSSLTRYCTIWPRLPDFISWPQKVEFCETVSKDVNLISDLTETLPFFIALVWNGYMYVRIIYALSSRPLTDDVDAGGNVDAQTVTRNQLKQSAARIRTQVARSLIINGILFFICQVWIRVNDLNNIYKHFSGKDFNIYRMQETYGIMLVFGRCMLYVNSSLNPFVYNLASAFYRNAFKVAFCGSCKQPTATSTVKTVSSSL